MYNRLLSLRLNLDDFTFFERAIKLCPSSSHKHGCWRPLRPYNASGRRNEIGPPRSWSQPHSVIRLLLKKARAITTIGLILGAPTLHFGSKFFEKEFFKLKPLNPILIAASLDPAAPLRQH